MFVASKLLLSCSCLLGSFSEVSLKEYKSSFKSRVSSFFFQCSKNIVLDSKSWWCFPLNLFVLLSCPFGSIISREQPQEPSSSLSKAWCRKELESILLRTFGKKLHHHHWHEGCTVLGSKRNCLQGLSVVKVKCLETLLMTIVVKLLISLHHGFLRTLAQDALWDKEYTVLILQVSFLHS